MIRKSGFTKGNKYHARRTALPRASPFVSNHRQFLRDQEVIRWFHPDMDGFINDYHFVAWINQSESRLIFSRSLDVAVCVDLLYAYKREMREYMERLL